MDEKKLRKRIEDGLKRRAGFTKTAWNTVKDVTDNIDFLKARMSAAKPYELSASINARLVEVIESDSYERSAYNPNPPLSDADIDKIIAYAQRTVGEEPGRLDSKILDPGARGR